MGDEPRFEDYHQVPKFVHARVNLPYNWKIWRGIKFGSLAVYLTAAKLKSTNISYLHNYVCMVIPYRTTKFKSANIFAMAIWGPTAKFNSRQ